jgi:tRNA A-37 threonylcarbamoyl transferase component Bud32
MNTRNRLYKNRYRIRIKDLIGRGEQGKVYKAKDEKEARTVALKIVSGSKDAREVAAGEARFLKDLDHKALIKVTDYFSDGTEQYLVMNYIPGEDLDTLLKFQGGPFPLEVVLRWADQLLDVLDYLHTRSSPIIHRDIKPQNLKLNERGEIVLLDFGLAKDAANGTLVYGYTKPYSPYEQITGRSTDARSDLYALGATLYHLITGITPTDAVERDQALRTGQPDPLRPSHEINNQIPPAISEILVKALEPDRELRWLSASEMRVALRGSPGNTSELVTVPMPVAPVLAAEITGVPEGRHDEPGLPGKWLEKAVTETAVFKEEKGRRQLFYRLTNEGVRIVFFDSLEAPIKCALEIARAIKIFPDLNLRMGIGAGPVQLEWVDGNISNVIGPGIKIAEDVMRCGDPGHILLTKAMVDHLEGVGNWSKVFVDFGEYKIGSGRQLRIFNLYKKQWSLVIAGIINNILWLAKGLITRSGGLSLQFPKSQRLGDLGNPNPTAIEAIVKPESPDKSESNGLRRIGLTGAAILLFFLGIWGIPRISSIVRPGPSPLKTLPSAVPVKIMEYYLELKGGKRIIESEGMGPNEGFRINFLPHQDGYLYILTPGREHRPMTLLTAKPKPFAGVSTNKVEKDILFKFPGERASPLGTPATDWNNVEFTIIFSANPLKTPNFFDKLALRNLSDMEIAEWDGFRSQYEEVGFERTTNPDSTPRVNIVSISQAKAGTSPLIFDVTIPRKQGDRR